jgi:hypothetical protein
MSVEWHIPLWSEQAYLVCRLPFTGGPTGLNLGAKVTHEVFY